jgi:hypothetical protein
MPKQGSEVVDIELYLHHETPAAILVSPNNVRGSPKNVWLAKRLVEYEMKKGNVVKVTMPVWLATEKELV